MERSCRWCGAFAAAALLPVLSNFCRAADGTAPADNPAVQAVTGSQAFQNAPPEARQLLQGMGECGKQQPAESSLASVKPCYSSSKGGKTVYKVPSFATDGNLKFTGAVKMESVSDAGSLIEKTQTFLDNRDAFAAHAKDHGIGTKALGQLLHDHAAASGRVSAPDAEPGFGAYRDVDGRVKPRLVRAEERHAAMRYQRALKSLGLYSGKVDGRFGPGTRTAVESFQDELGLVADHGSSDYGAAVGSTKAYLLEAARNPKKIQSLIGIYRQQKLSDVNVAVADAPVPPAPASAALQPKLPAAVAAPKPARRLDPIAPPQPELPPPPPAPSPDKSYAQQERALISDNTLSDAARQNAEAKVLEEELRAKTLQAAKLEAERKARLAAAAAAESPYGQLVSVSKEQQPSDPGLQALAHRLAQRSSAPPAPAPRSCSGVWDALVNGGTGWFGGQGDCRLPWNK